MIERGARGDGLIIVFNNGLENLSDYRRSKVQAIQPISGEVDWEYSSELFFSSVGGTAQPLPGNNVLITSSHGGRVFELRPSEQIVWEWVPPFLPMRVERVAYDHCPQLASLGTPEETEVIPEDRHPHVDAGLYRFAFKWETEERTIDGRRKWAMQSNNDCRDLLIPRGAKLRTEFGIDRERLAGRSVVARFRVTVDDHDRPTNTVVDEVVDESSESLWRRRTVALGRYSMQHVTMCIGTEVAGGIENSEGVVLWANPQILSRKDRQRRIARSGRISDQERRLREQQLKALGYVD
jgi:hypothetical protein